METQSTINTANLCHIIRFYLQAITNTDEPVVEEQQAKAEGLIQKPQRYYLGSAYLTTRERQCVNLLVKNTSGSLLRSQRQKYGRCPYQKQPE